MKLFMLIFIMIFSIISCAFAQQASPEVMGLQAKIIQELHSNIQCITGTISLQQQNAGLTTELTKAQARIKELESKQEKGDAK